MSEIRTASHDEWLRLMPVVFVLIWSTGFIVARYGMPYAPPFTFLLFRYFFSILCFLPWIVLARVAWPRDRRQVLHLAVTGVLMHAGDSAFILGVDGFVGRDDVVIKPLSDIKPKGIAGATLSGDGSIVLVLDMEELLADMPNELTNLIFTQG